uniref:Uncharacterized protein n=1 Tax=Arundo donax TaxID=35708 RepID=A0A0A9GD12_ARUDO
MRQICSLSFMSSSCRQNGTRGGQLTAAGSSTLGSPQ